MGNRSIDEMLSDAAARVAMIRESDKKIPADFGQFGSLCRRRENAQHRLELALNDFVSEINEILYDLQRLDKRPKVKETP